MLFYFHTPHKSRVKKLYLSEISNHIGIYSVELAAMAPRGYASAVTTGGFKGLIRVVDFYGILLLMVVSGCWPESVLVGIDSTLSSHGLLYMWYVRVHPECLECFCVGTQRWWELERVSRTSGIWRGVHMLPGTPKVFCQLTAKNRCGL